MAWNWDAFTVPTFCASHLVYCCRCDLKLSMDVVTRRGYFVTLAYYKLRGDCGKSEHKLVSWPSYYTDKFTKLFDWIRQWTYCLLYMRIFFSKSSNAFKQWSLAVVIRPSSQHLLVFAIRKHYLSFEPIKRVLIKIDW